MKKAVTENSGMKVYLINGDVIECDVKQWRDDIALKLHFIEKEWMTILIPVTSIVRIEFQKHDIVKDSEAVIVNNYK